MADAVAFTYIGGPTALIEFSGLRFLTDPAFDPAGSQFPSGPATLKKLAGPALPTESLGEIDIVLLSHDHHSDNLDRSGRQLLGRARRVVTTEAGAARLGGNTAGIAPWQSIEVPSAAAGIVKITGTPCRHGPAHMDRGPVTGFVLQAGSGPVVYISGDTVWYDGVAAVSNRFQVDIAVLFMGAARVPQIVDAPLTMTALDAVEAARAFSGAKIVPLHYEGWAHFSESREIIAAAFAGAGLSARLHWLKPGQKVLL
jgi:L-ascorbate metabolism protein UlaG (beta-lactamase superfamily)